MTITPKVTKVLWQSETGRQHDITALPDGRRAIAYVEESRVVGLDDGSIALGLAGGGSKEIPGDIEWARSSRIEGDTVILFAPGPTIPYDED
jgi:hypothetical protein